MFFIKSLLSLLLVLFVPLSAFSLNVSDQEVDLNNPTLVFKKPLFSAQMMPELKLYGMDEVQLNLIAQSDEEYISEISFFKNVYECRRLGFYCELKEKVRLSSLVIPLVRIDENTLITDSEFEEGNGLRLRVNIAVERRNRLVNEVELRKFIQQKNYYRRVFLGRASLENTF